MTRDTLLFLDIDGVLNSVSFYKARADLHAAKGQGIHSLDPVAVKNLQYIVSSTDCKIVIMSTWRRIHSIEKISALISEQGYEGIPPIIGATPVMQFKTRGAEVAEYLHSMTFRHYPKRFACLDDDDDFYRHQNLVQCDNEYGLTEELAESVITLLKTGA